jgi:hypothetical protein
MKASNLKQWKVEEFINFIWQKMRVVSKVETIEDGIQFCELKSGYRIAVPNGEGDVVLCDTFEISDRARGVDRTVLVLFNGTDEVFDAWFDSIVTIGLVRMELAA